MKLAFTAENSVAAPVSSEESCPLLGPASVDIFFAYDNLHFQPPFRPLGLP